MTHLNKRLEVRLVTAITLGLLLVGIQLAKSAFNTQPISFDSDCQNCHLAGDKVNADNATLLTGSQEMLCSKCHPGAVQASHPSAVTPSMQVPEEFPLDWKGDLTCSSCHIIHQNGHGPLRIDATGAPFCTACHPQDFFERMADQGGSLLVSGHLEAGNNLKELGLDPYSIKCMECHDEKGSNEELSLNISLTGVARHNSGRVNHPIGIDYAESASFGGYRPIAALAPSIILPNGRISCVSCHDGYSSDHGAAVIANTGSSLCFQCHDI